MRTVLCTLEILSWWHAGSGLGRGGDVDALVIRDAAELPYLPARTLKGLLRDALQLAEDHGAVSAGRTAGLFGAKDPRTLHPDGIQADVEDPGRKPGVLHFSDATLDSRLKEWLVAGGPGRRAAFTAALSSTALQDGGVAAPKTLRTIEAAPPVVLTATITGPDDPGWIATLRQVAGLVRSLGSHRHRGLGRCRLTLTEATPVAGTTTTPLPPAAAADGCVWLDITLESDLVLSASAATTGGHDSLDFLPGSALLGAAAARLFQDPGFGPEVFLGGGIRFGDGLPLAPDDAVAWPIPLNCHFVKQDGPVGRPINALKDTEPLATARRRVLQQAQQLRTGHLTASGLRLEAEGDYVLKTALDRDGFGRARDRQLFEYETIAAGSRFCASIRWNPAVSGDTDRVARIVEVLTDPGLRLGRSRSAEFGAVSIRVRGTAPDLPTPQPDGVAADEPGAPPHPVHFYLASDLALAGPGAPRLTPVAADFGLPSEWVFQPDRSFLRTRRYSPWNAFHHCRTTERQVLARGSVLTFAGADGQAISAELLSTVVSFLQAGVGEHRGEGLGRVLLNPDFVLKLPVLRRNDSSAPDSPPPGESVTTGGGAGPGQGDCRVIEADRNVRAPVPSEHGGAAPGAPPDSAGALAAWVARRQTDRQIQQHALALGSKWAELFEHPAAAGQNERLDRSGRSQWNHVRQLATRAGGDRERLLQKLTEFCGATLRQRYWKPSDTHRSPWSQLERILSGDSALLQAAGPLPDGIPTDPLICAALAAAAETVVLELQKPQRPPNSPRRAPAPNTPAT